MSKENELPPASEEFKDAVRGAGSIYVECQLCGRIHFGNNENELTESLGEKGYKNLLKNSKKFPDKYVYHPDEEMVSWGSIDGESAVLDCQCNRLSRYENLFWNSKHIISEYFSARAKEELEDAQRNKDLADKLKGSTK